MAGVGKTELALQYALEHQQDYPGGLCWFQVRGADLGNQIRDFAISLLNLDPPEELNLIAQVKYCWRNWREGKVLIVLDDISNFNDYYKEKITPYLPPAIQTRFKILMTSRQQPGRAIQKIDLNVLSPEAALELLRSLVGEQRIDSELESAQDLCTWLGYLPLGLELVGRYLELDEDFSLEEILNELQNLNLDADALSEVVQGDMTAKPGVASAFELSWKSLNQDQNSQALACLLSLFAPSSIPWSLVESVEEDKESKDLLKKSRRALLQLNLIQRVGKKIYQVHPLIREFFKAKLNELPKAEEVKRKFCKGMAEIVRTRMHALSREIVSHIIEAANVAIFLLETEITRSNASQNIITDLSSEICTFVGQLFSFSYYQDAEDNARRLEEIVLNSNFELSLTGNLYLQLGWIFGEQGRSEDSRDYFQRSLNWGRLYRRIDLQSDSYQGLGWLEMDSGNLQEAERYKQESLTLARKSQDPNKISIQLAGLGFILSRRGQYPEATQYLEEGLEIARQEGNNYNLAILLDYSAQICIKLGNYIQAREYLNEEENIPKISAYREKYIELLANLGWILDATGEHMEATKKLEEGLKLAEQVGNPARKSLILANLVQTHINQGNYLQAEQYADESLRIATENNFIERIIFLKSNLSIIRAIREDCQSAINLWESSYELVNELEDPWLTAYVLNAGGNISFRQSNFENAANYFRQANEIGEHIKSRSLIATSLYGLAKVKKEQGLISEARTLARESLDIFNNIEAFESRLIENWLNQF